MLSSLTIWIARCKNINISHVLGHSRLSSHLLPGGKPPAQLNLRFKLHKFGVLPKEMMCNIASLEFLRFWRVVLFCPLHVRSWKENIWALSLNLLLCNVHYPFLDGG
uniref:Putative glucosamine--fructose-6-phosphate aminotransferase n=1 Tax=Davidia involucrata TaxID=16924 RepID=A0A5B6Z116_DAVIN